MSTAHKDNAFADYLPAFLLTLLGDARVSGKQDLNGPLQTRRRNFARQTFAFLDGGVACMRTLALVAVSPKLRPTEVAALYGNVEIKQQSVTRAKRQAAHGQVLLLANHVLHTHLGLELIDKEGDDWQSFTQVRELRNCVTHPRLPEHLEISDADFGIIERTLSWLETLVGTAFKETAAVLGRPNLAEDVVHEMLKEW
jgi:hypothetical protein